jgi:hypothetical protein
MEAAREIPTSPENWRIGTGYGFANASGRAARALFTAVTGRHVNAWSRPDVSSHAAELAEKIMLAVPTEGPAFWRDHTVAANRYAALLHDINGLIGAGRSELILAAIAESRFQEDASIFATPDSSELRRYLHPMSETTALEAFVRYLLPVLTLVVAIGALFVTLGKP